MENQEKEKQEAGYTENWNVHHSPAGRILGGLVILAVGGLLLVKQMNILVIPAWVFTWQMLLIAIGVYIGARHTFHGAGWLIPIVIGVVMLIDQFYPDVQMKNYLWPGVIILVGLFMIFTSRRRHVWHSHHRHDWRKHNRKWREYSHKWQRERWGAAGDEALFHSSGTASEDYIDSVSVFGGVSKNVISKNFKGGDVVTVFGGTEINLSQADISGRVILELTQVFGGTTLIVPPHWKIDQAEMVAFAGSIEDKRPLQTEATQDPNKVLVLRGNTVFGGLEIKSF